MPTTYVMTAGAVIDAEGRTVVNGPVGIYLAEAGGTAIAPATLKQADGTAWPIEGTKTDGNGKVKVQWPDAAGTPPALLYVDSARGRWEMLPVDLSARVKDLEDNPVTLTDEQADVIDTAARVVGGVLVDPDGDPIPTGEVTADAINDALEGADALDLPAGTTIGDAVPGTYTFDETAQTVTVATDNGTITLTGVYTAGGGTPPPPDYESLVVTRHRLPVPTTTAANLWTPEKGTPYITWAVEPGGADSTYVPDAFATGVHGFRIATDTVKLAVTSSSPEPGTGRGLLGMSMRDVTVTGSVNRWFIRFDAGLSPLFGVILGYSGGTFTWSVDRTGTGTIATAAATQTAGTYGGAPAILGPLAVGVVLKGATSQLLIASTGGTQTIGFDLSGVSSYDTVDFSPGDSGATQGAQTQRQTIWGPSGFTSGQVTAALADLADDAEFTIGA